MSSNRTVALPRFGKANNLSANEGKMFVPFSYARIKQLDQPTAVGRNCCEIGPFLKIAIRTGQRQIRRVVAALVLPSSYVFDVKSEIWGRRLWKTAIFATLLRSLSNEISRIRVHLRKPMGAEKLPGFTLQKSNHVESGAELLVFRLFVSRQCAFVGPISKLFESGLSCFVRAQGNNSFGCLRSKAGDKWV
jgi:hypothetical protein